MKIHNSLGSVVASLFQGSRKSILLICIFFFSSVVFLSLRIQYQKSMREKIQLDAQLLEVSRSIKLVKIFQKPFDSIQKRHNIVANTRVRWTEKLENITLQTRQADFQFSIGDPEIIETDLTRHPSIVKVKQFPVHIEATLNNDSNLLVVLRHLSEHSQELFENRGCDIRRELNSHTLRLKCLYVIYDIDFRAGSV